MTIKRRNGSPRPVECTYYHNGKSVKRTRASSALRALQCAVKHLTQQDYRASTCKIGDFDQARDYCRVQRIQRKLTVTLLRGSL